jgi:crossover junction endodeoxyribonuclease RuvC
MSNFKVGIDPGITGAIAILNDELRCISIVDMPIMPLGLKRQQVNPAGLHSILDFAPSPMDVTIYLEQVASMPHQGVGSMFNFGMSYGMIQGICAAMSLSLILVRPATWKKAASLIGKPKDAARTLAQQLYPEVDLSLKKHIGRADALLIARFGFLK